MTIAKIRDDAMFKSGYIEGVRDCQKLMRQEDYANTKCYIPCSLMAKVQELIDDYGVEYVSNDNEENHERRISRIKEFSAKLP